MSDIELVIKIPEAYYELVIKRCKDPVLLNAFKNGTPLPKGHGRILDEKEILDTKKNAGIWFDPVEMSGYIGSIPAIIEAEKDAELINKTISLLDSKGVPRRYYSFLEYLDDGYQIKRVTYRNLNHEWQLRYLEKGTITLLFKSKSLKKVCNKLVERLT